MDLFGSGQGVIEGSREHDNESSYFIFLTT
jgi:hypothetical protein